jgi:PAS domain S-box-containing protein
MISAKELDEFLTELDSRRQRLVELSVPERLGPDALRHEVADLSEQLLIADEELRVQQEQLDESRAIAESITAGYARFFDSSPQPLVLTDENGAVLRTSRGVRTLTGRTTEIAPRPVATWFATADRRAVRAAITSLKRFPDRPVNVGRVVVQRADRTEVAVFLSASTAIRLSSRSSQVVWTLMPAKGDWSQLRLLAHESDATRIARAAEHCTELAVDLAHCESIDDAYSRIVRRAASFFPHTCLADVFVSGASLPFSTTPLTTTPLATSFVELQRAANEGPAVDALGGCPVRTDDIGEDSRWSRLRSSPQAEGLRAVLAVPISSSNRPIAVVIWGSDRPQSFGESDEATAVQFATHAGLGLQRLLTEGQLRIAVTRRQHVGEAVGILMERYQINAQQAFDLLRQASQHSNRKVADIATRLIETGEEPSFCCNPSEV